MAFSSVIQLALLVFREPVRQSPVRAQWTTDIIASVDEIALVPAKDNNQNGVAGYPDGYGSLSWRRF
jgi:hypothetical protein